MKKNLSLFIVSLFTLALSAQKVVNDYNAEKRNVNGFHAIVVSGGIDLYLSQGDEAVAVSAAKPEHREKIKTEVKDGILKIWYDWNSAVKFDIGNRKLKAYVSVKELDKLQASGGSDVLVDGTLKFSKLEFKVSGGSDLNGNVETQEMSVKAGGGSDVNLTGKTARLIVDVSGGSDFSGYGFSADVCNVEASGGSDVYITVNKELSASASGGSDVFYKGTGLIRDLKTSGSNIRKVSK